MELGAAPLALPEICFFEQFVVSEPKAPPQLIEGILHQGCKRVLGGTSKSKSRGVCLTPQGLRSASRRR
jgi:hypothetical protein